MSATDVPEFAVLHFRNIGFRSAGTDTGGPMFITAVHSAKGAWKDNVAANRRFSTEALTRLQSEGVLDVELSYSGRRARFSIADLLAPVKVKTPKEKVSS
jgi:hypothetical protein